MTKLHKNMSVAAFETGYFYAAELKAFARELGIEVGHLRKNEVEDHIKAYLSGETGISLPKSVANRKSKGDRDVLSPDSRIINYVDDKATKAFLKKEIAKRQPALKDKSGQWYWLNDWRKEQIKRDRALTYRDLIDRLYALMITKGRLARIPSTRFNNFVTDFLADPDTIGATRREAMAAWEKLKKLPVEKTYRAYKTQKETSS